MNTANQTEITGLERGDDPVAHVMQHYGCDHEDALLFLGLRDEGYSVYQAGVMAGIRDADY
ncbi:hypothetical protein [Pusillimonas sp. T7-7]|uniref:hypothetical protein n=1 Tax=Pusillimonas sp. (strain T7-7) TaxID=1007105 RepID=UPI0011D17F08|nr:hypothetical protein [Pusillimonas sp. T7-7]